MIRNTFVLITLMIGIILAACSGGGSSNKPDLQGEWTLTLLNGQSPLAGTTITASFDNNEISGSTGCNQYGGQYRLNGNELTFSDIFQTEMACMEPVGAMEQEFSFTQALGQATNFMILDGILQIQNSSGETILEFVKK